MAFDFQTHDAPDIAPLVRQDDQSLSAKDRRRFAAVEALPLGHGGTPDMAHLLGCAPHPIQAGLRELPPLPDDPAGPRVRNPGGGRQKTAATHPAWLQNGQATSKERTAGDPRRDDGPGTDATHQPMPHRRDTLAVSEGSRLDRRRRETPAGDCGSLRWLWDSDGRRLEPNGSALLLVGAGGGRNICDTPRCQAALPAVVNAVAVPIRFAPSPASASKGNPIDRRLFRH